MIFARKFRANIVVIFQDSTLHWKKRDAECLLSCTFTARLYPDKQYVLNQNYNGVLEKLFSHYQIVTQKNFSNGLHIRLVKDEVNNDRTF